ncbi:MAG: methyltransferase family protein [Candidatus Acidiferrales bacterium]
MNFDYGAWAARRRVPLSFAFAVAYAVLSQPTFELLVIGSALALTGLLLRAFAAGHIEKSQTLAASGPFCYVRHPLYLGSFILGCGFMVAARSYILGTVYLVLFAAMYFPVMRREEAFLHKKFGAAYDDYAHRVPLFFPLRGQVLTAAGRFTWLRYRKNREYQAALGFVAIIIFLAIKLALR